MKRGILNILSGQEPNVGNVGNNRDVRPVITDFVVQLLNEKVFDAQTDSQLKWFLELEEIEKDVEARNIPIPPEYWFTSDNLQILKYHQKPGKDLQFAEKLENSPSPDYGVSWALLPEMMIQIMEQDIFSTGDLYSIRTHFIYMDTSSLNAIPYSQKWNIYAKMEYSRFLCSRLAKWRLVCKEMACCDYGFGGNKKEIMTPGSYSIFLSGSKKEFKNIYHRIATTSYMPSHPIFYKSVSKMLHCMFMYMENGDKINNPPFRILEKHDADAWNNKYSNMSIPERMKQIRILNEERCVKIGKKKVWEINGGTVQQIWKDV